jgi:hypothetical protein
MNAAEIDSITVLHSVSSKYATKQFSTKKDDSISNRSYGNEKFFSVATVAVGDIAQLGQALGRLVDKPFDFVIRGEPLPDINRKHARRLLHADKKTGDAATFQGRRRHWFMADIDHIPCPAAINPVIDPDGAIEYIIGLLPPELHDATCWWEFSSSQSVFADETLSAHLWFWSSGPLDDAELTRWALAVNQAARHKLIDPAPYRAVQAHYVARPIFKQLKDPLPRRYGMRQGLDAAVSLLIPPPHPKRPDEPLGQGYEPGLGVEAYLAEIGGPKGFRGPLVAAIASYVAIHGSSADAEPLKRQIRETLDKAHPGGRSASELERYASDDHLDAIVDWVRTHHGDQPPKGRQEDPPQHVVDPDIPIDPLEEDIRPAQFSDDHLALRFSEIHADKLRYVALWGTWMLWNATLWQHENTLKAFDLARALCRLASAQINDSRAVKLAAAIASAKTVAAVERLARADRCHAMMTDQFDADTWAFNRSRRGQT